jgi:hypothetical protein
LNPQIGIIDITNLVFISARTANRILNKLRDNGVVRFSIICNPSLMKGFVVFGLLIYVNDNDEGEKGELGKGKYKFNSHKVLERLYSEMTEYPFLRTLLLVMTILLLRLSSVMMYLRLIQCLREYCHLKR